MEEKIYKHPKRFDCLKFKFQGKEYETEMMLRDDKITIFIRSFDCCKCEEWRLITCQEDVFMQHLELGFWHEKFLSNDELYDHIILLF